MTAVNDLTACCPDCTGAGRTGFAERARHHADLAVQHAADARRHADRAARAFAVSVVVVACALTAMLILVVATLS